MSIASSEQSCVCEGPSYDEVYPLGQDDDDLDGNESESDSNEDIGNDEPPI